MDHGLEYIVDNWDRLDYIDKTCVLCKYKHAARSERPEWLDQAGIYAIVLLSKVALIIVNIYY